MRICLSPGTIGGGGIGIVMLNLAEAFLVMGHDVDILLLEEQTDRTLPAGASGVMLGRRARTALPNAVRYLRQARPDLVISARDYVNVLMLAAQRLSRVRARLIWTFHTHRESQLDGVPRRADRVADGLTRLLIGCPNRLVAVSEGVAEGLVREFHLPPGRMHVIQNPVWTPARQALAAGASPHPWLGRGATIVAVGRLVPQKDFPTLIAAFTLVRQANPQAKLVILGEGEDRAALAAQSAGMRDAIDMPGHVDNPLAYLAHADLFVLSSRWEGFPLALVEALGCGCPVVATDCPAGPSEILQQGRLGALVPIGDADAMASAMLAALAAPGDRTERRAAALQFTGEVAAARYLADG